MENAQQVLTEAQALQLAGETFRIDINDPQSPMMILPPKVYPDGWLFWVNSRDYVENRNKEANVRGGGQLLVANDGRLMSLGSGSDSSLAFACQTVQEAFVKLEEIRSGHGRG